MPLRFTISNEELNKELIGSVKTFPKYTSPILNLANYFSKGTAPKVVGQMTELIKECPFDDYEKWKEWYLKKKPEGIKNATIRVNDMIHNFKYAIQKIDEKMIKEWVEDLTIGKTFVGLKFQDVILKKIAYIKGKTYRSSTPKEEAQGIDGFIGEIHISIKPDTYNSKRGLSEHIVVQIIFYKKTKTGISVDATQLG